MNELAAMVGGLSPAEHAGFVLLPPEAQQLLIRHARQMVAYNTRNCQRRATLERRRAELLFGGDVETVEIFDDLARRLSSRTGLRLREVRSRLLMVVLIECLSPGGRHDWQPRRRLAVAR